MAALVGDAGGNILEVSHNRMMSGHSAKSATLGLVIEARDAEHAGEIRDEAGERRVSRLITGSPPRRIIINLS